MYLKNKLFALLKPNIPLEIEVTGLLNLCLI